MVTCYVNDLSLLRVTVLITPWLIISNSQSQKLMQFFWPWFGFTFIQTSNADQSDMTIWSRFENAKGLVLTCRYIIFYLSRELIELSLTTKQFHSWHGSFIGEHSFEQGFGNINVKFGSFFKKNYIFSPYQEQNKILKQIKCLSSCSFIDRNMKLHIHDSRDELVILLCNV